MQFRKVAYGVQVFFVGKGCHAFSFLKKKPLRRVAFRDIVRIMLQRFRLLLQQRELLQQQELQLQLPLQLG